MDEVADSPLNTAEISGVANDIHTDIFCSNYENMMLIIITQYGKLGTMIHVKKEAALDGTDMVPVYFTNVLFGEDEVLTHVVARNLADKIDIKKPILFNLALKDKSASTVKDISKLLECCKFK